MNEQLWWFLARSSGLVAGAMLTMTVLAGVLLAGRLSGRRPGPCWTLDLHRGVAALSLWLTGLHVASIVADSYVEFGLADVLVPMASQWRPAAVSAGVIAMWLLVVVQVSSLVRKRRFWGRQLSNKVWRRLHWLSYAAWLLVLGHTVTAGTDALLPQVLSIGTGATAAVIVYAVVRWTTKPKRRRPAQRESAATAATQ